MITVNIKSHNNLIKEITIMGHAKFDVKGKDIVCASVSAIAITSINAILSLNEDAIYYEEKSNKLIIKINDDNQTTQILINNMLNLFKEIKIDYPKNIGIRNEE